jgi:tetratricopeptide (TPR) repeat protein
MAGLAQAQFENLQFEAALQSFKAAEGALNAVIAAERGGFETQSFLAYALGGIADCLQELGQLDEAIRYSKQSLAMTIDLRKAGPNDSLEEDITVSQMHLAWLLAKSGRAREGVDFIETVVSDARKNLLKKPEVAAAQRRLAVASQVKAKVLLLSGQDTAACTAARYSYLQWQLTQKLGGLLEMDRIDPGTIPALTKMLKKCGVTAQF